MKKGIIITGSDQSGKGLLVRMLTNENNSSILDGRNRENVFRYSDHKRLKKSEYIVIDEVSDLSFFYQFIDQGFIELERSCKESVILPIPKLIIITEGIINLSNESEKRRFDIYNTDTMTYQDVVKLIKDHKIIIEK